MLKILIGIFLPTKIKRKSFGISNYNLFWWFYYADIWVGFFGVCLLVKLPLTPVTFIYIWMNLRFEVSIQGVVFGVPINYHTFIAINYRFKSTCLNIQKQKWPRLCCDKLPLRKYLLNGVGAGVLENWVLVSFRSFLVIKLSP